MPGRTIIITGASKGIGAAIAERFHHTDNDITDFVLLARESPQFDTLLEKLDADNPFRKRVHPHRIDLVDGESLAALLREIHSRIGTVHVLVNNAGFTAPQPLGGIDPAALERTFRVNLYAPVTIVNELLSLGNDFDLIVNIASTAGVAGRAGWLAYSASKAAVINMSEVMRAELKPHGTRVACLSPGRCATDLRRTLAPHEDPATIMQPSDVAEVVELLASDTGRLIDSGNLICRV